MEILVICILFIVGIILLIAEVYMFPGISLAGICATASLIAANVYAYMSLGWLACLICLLVTIVGCTVILVWVARSKSIDKVSLKKEIDSTVRNEALDAIQVGEHGTAITRLALIGNADFGGRIIEVKSASGFIEENTPITVIRITDGIVFVSADR